ncbi:MULTISPECIES: SDR family oxidoreductase [unclassified Streptomyces]|uniref:SDR family oxidoreductase n=1 Tax=unclassified Streptomyces TaxID=2593676 RepID=UPI001F03747D|nr:MULTISPECIES: SDR family oxidoreductase [unclassified Streptomyces]MCH0561731.1 SDR family oxidoreductase [Streptomyces sp. MUM 2J]MCH0569017.1 SDR family oxidoreductase [Streptomyces sp. MUM 136J]
MSTRTVLITGTSSGIGQATAVAAARAGWRVIATMRDTAKAGPLLAAAEEAGVAVDVRPLDVTDPATVEACLAGLDRLDALVNNAGAGHVGTLEQESVEDVRAVMEVNFFGVLHVTKAALPLLRAAKGRVLTVTSVGGVVGQPFNEAYCAAKFAVEGFMESLAPVAATAGVSVSVVEPGAVASEFVSNVGVTQDVLDRAGRYAPALSAYLERTRGAFSGAQTPQDVAEQMVDLLSVERPAFRVLTSDAARAFAGTKLKDLDGSAVQTLTGTWVAP